MSGREERRCASKFPAGVVRCRGGRAGLSKTVDRVIEASQEARLARRAATGDREALQALYEEHSDTVFAVAYRLTDSSPDAKDVLQEVFAKLPTALKRFDRRSSLGTWLRIVAARTALKLVRARQRRREVPIDPELTSSPPLVLDIIALERALATQPQGRVPDFRAGR
ncbi:sigma-70 family RNA polymerase sigma factor [Candidatus Palauibacter soopunensis]|uniref:RNA polymerase sigma factor n=1 Tax=Candidatus Palauibacter soopunensis TaxID=3056739 RepID=UPI002873A04D|nr:sigma-70 family RNA polymerase sigma factor [Candidatus Palauibacter soopunensis]